MNQSFDYAALVEQHMADERMAQQLQQRELQDEYQVRNFVNFMTIETNYRQTRTRS